MKKDSQKRALALPTNEVGNLRGQTYTMLISRMKQSIAVGYYLEAIALQESIIADRLESRLNFLSPDEDYSFKTLERLISAFEKKEPGNIVVKRVSDWKEKRNKALHEMAKIRDHDHLTWTKKMEDAKIAAEEGVILFRDVDNMIRSLRA